MEEISNQNQSNIKPQLRSRSRRILRYIIKKHLQSQKYAWRGLYEIFQNQLNFKIQLSIGFVVIILGVFFEITKIEWVIISFLITLVLVSEAFNSSIEAMCDALSKEYNENIRYTKDVAAGAVLLSAILSIIIGMSIFLPYILSL